MSLKDEILGEMIKADFAGNIHSSNYGILAENILKIFEKSIDEIKPHPLMEIHCILAVNYAKDRMKELLK